MGIVAHRRTATALAVIVLTAAVLGARLVDLQVVQARALDTKSSAARGVEEILPGIRGSITDADGAVLAETVYRYTAALSPVAAMAGGRAAMVAAATKIGAITGQGGTAIIALIDNALKADPKAMYALVKSDLDVRTFDSLDALPYPWLSFTKTAVRSYPNGAVGGALLGYVSAGGKGGIESSEDTCLAGSDGLETYQRGADGVPIPGSTVVSKKAKDGGTLTLTIDRDLQWFTEQTLAQQVAATGSRFGFVTVAEAKTGKIRAIAQWPAVDPNDIGATNRDYWGLLPFTTPYEPGSTFKALTASMLIDQGKATPTTQVLAPYRFRSGAGADLHDPDYHADPERLTLTGVLMNSSNTGMSILGERLSDETRYSYLKSFGIGQDTGIPYPGQSSGILLPVSEWDDQTKYATMFGQGVSATQIQLVSAYQALADNGVRVPLSVVEGCTTAGGTRVRPPLPAPTRVISSTTAKLTVGMMESVVTDGELSNQLRIPGYNIAAKTGTAQQPDGKGGYQSTFYVSVMGIAPADDPRYVISVNLGYPTTTTSSAAAAPLFHSIVARVLKTYRVTPSGGPPSDYPPTY